MAWQVYTVRHSAFDLGLVGLVIFAPSLLFAPLGGIVADRVDRRAILAVAALVEVAVSLALIPLYGGRGAPTLVFVLALLAVAGISRAFAFPAEESPSENSCEWAVRPSAVC